MENNRNVVVEKKRVGVHLGSMWDRCTVDVVVDEN